jgi:hypothetical protein
MTIQYIYFEICWQIGGQFPYEPYIKNENILLLKPKTNSNGIYGFRNITASNRHDVVSANTYVDQNWVDLTKYKKTTLVWNDPVYGDFDFDKWVVKAIKKIVFRIENNEVDDEEIIYG